MSLESLIASLAVLEDAQLQETLQLAASGDLDALCEAAAQVLFHRDMEVRSNLGTAAVSCLHHAAERGHAVSQHLLASAYGHGMGVDRDLRESLRWLQQAGAGGHARARAELATRVRFEDFDRLTEILDELASDFSDPPVIEDARSGDISAVFMIAQILLYEKRPIGIAQARVLLGLAENAGDGGAAELLARQIGN